MGFAGDAYQKIGFESLTKQIDTTTSGGKLIFHIFGALAEFERDIIKERTNAGLEAARTRAKLGGTAKSAVSGEDQTGPEALCGYGHVCQRNLQDAWDLNAYAPAVCEGDRKPILK